MNYLVTSIKKNDWEDFGKSWISSSLIYSGIKPEEIIVFTDDSKISNDLMSLNIQSIVCNFESRLDIFLKICDHSKKHYGNYAYWDCCVFFQKDITSIFKEEIDKFFLCENKNLGFVYGKSSVWKIFDKIKNTIDFFKKENFDLFFLKNYSHLISSLDQTWNYTNVNCLDNLDGTIKYQDIIPKAINVGNLKNSIVGKKILYKETHRNELEKLIKKKVFSLRIKKE